MKALDHASVTKFDEVCDTALDSLRGNPVADRVFYSLSEAANHSILWHTATWLPVILGRRSAKQAVGLSLALGIESGLVNGVIKQFFRRERPVVTEERPHGLRKPKTSSFPSGHATSAVCAAILMSRPGTKRYWFPLAGAVATSRAYVRIHHASDVIGGIGVGVVLGLVAKAALRRFV